MRYWLFWLAAPSGVNRKAFAFMMLRHVINLEILTATGNVNKYQEYAAKINNMIFEEPS